MTLKTGTYLRKTFSVEAVEVTEENIQLVAQWCGGTVKTTSRNVGGEADGESKPSRVESQVITLEVYRPISARHTKAFVGDWILKSSFGFKIYTPKAFHESFIKSDSEPVFGGLSTNAVGVSEAIKTVADASASALKPVVYSFRDSLGQRGLDETAVASVLNDVQEYVRLGMTQDEAEAASLEAAGL